MHTRDPEKFHWYRLQKDVPAEEEGELKEEEDEEVQEQEPQQDLNFDDEPDPEWEVEQDGESDVSNVASFVKFNTMFPNIVQFCM